MNVLFYANPEVVSKGGILRDVTKIPGLSGTIVSDQDHFASTLMANPGRWTLIVFFAKHEDDLHQAVSLKAFMAKARLIIILAEKRSAMVSRALSLNPILLSFANGNVGHVASILEEMVSDAA